MKLYTEEQVMKAYLSKPTQYGSIEKQIEEMFTPIELPTEDEIEKNARDENIYNNLQFRLGAKWVIEQLKSE